jgi:uncharacterized protein CbrC (UPF0167 family)
MDKKILIVCEKSEGYKYQGPRYKNLGPYSGEEFRDEHLIPWLDTLADSEEASVDFSGTVVYMPSFLEESFGGAIRKNNKNKDKLKNVSFLNMDKIWEAKLIKYINEAGSQKK